MLLEIKFWLYGGWKYMLHSEGLFQCSFSKQSQIWPCNQRQTGYYHLPVEWLSALLPRNNMFRCDSEIIPCMPHLENIQCHSGYPEMYLHSFRPIMMPVCDVHSHRDISTWHVYHCQWRVSNRWNQCYEIVGRVALVRTANIPVICALVISLMPTTICCVSRDGIPEPWIVSLPFNTIASLVFDWKNQIIVFVDQSLDSQWSVLGLTDRIYLQTQFLYVYSP